MNHTLVSTHVTVASRVKTRPTRTQGQGLVGVAIKGTARGAGSNFQDPLMLLSHTRHTPPLNRRPLSCALAGFLYVCIGPHHPPHAGTTPSDLWKGDGIVPRGGWRRGGVSDSPNQDKTIEISGRRLAGTVGAELPFSGSTPGPSPHYNSAHVPSRPPLPTPPRHHRRT